MIKNQRGFKIFWAFSRFLKCFFEMVSKRERPYFFIIFAAITSTLAPAPLGIVILIFFDIRSIYATNAYREIMLATAMANDFDSPFVSNFVFFGSGISDNA